MPEVNFDTDAYREEYMTLSAYLTQVRGLIDDQEGLPGWVVCELANVNWNRGHCYLELVETSPDGAVVAKARGTIWSYRAMALSRAFEDSCASPLRKGIKVMLYVQSQLSELYGFSLNVLDLDPSYTLGDLEAKKQATLKRLAEEDLLERNKELEVPTLPFRIAIVSAEGAAGFGDFMKHLSDSGVDFVTELFSALMQGEGAPESIAAAFGQIEERSGEFDAVAFIRGGGSNLDLACFDDYSLASRIARCPIPVFTAIGHEKDYHVADMVANTYVKTPTALADLFLDCYIAEDERLSAYESRLRISFHNRISSMSSRLDLLESRLRRSSGDRISEAFHKVEMTESRIRSQVDSRLFSQEHRLDRLWDAVRSSSLRLLDKAESKLSLTEEKIRVTNPINILSRGYVLPLDARGVKMTGASGSHPGDMVQMLFQDGRLKCKVEEVIDKQN